MFEECSPESKTSISEIFERSFDLGAQIGDMIFSGRFLDWPKTPHRDAPVNAQSGFSPIIKCEKSPSGKKDACSCGSSHKGIGATSVAPLAKASCSIGEKPAATISGNPRETAKASAVLLECDIAKLEELRSTNFPEVTEKETANACK